MCLDSSCVNGQMAWRDCALDEVELVGAGGDDRGSSSRGLGAAATGSEVAAAEEGSEGKHGQLCIVRYMLASVRESIAPRSSSTARPGVSATGASDAALGAQLEVTDVVRGDTLAEDLVVAGTHFG